MMRSDSADRLVECPWASFPNCLFNRLADLGWLGADKLAKMADRMRDRLSDLWATLAD